MSGVNCYKCGKFVKKENEDVSYNPWTGLYEIGYPECENCKSKNNTAKPRGQNE